MQPEPRPQNAGRAIQLARQVLGLTRTQLARLSSTSTNTIRAIETGQRRPAVTTFNKLYRALTEFSRQSKWDVYPSVLKDLDAIYHAINEVETEGQEYIPKRHYPSRREYERQRMHLAALFSSYRRAAGLTQRDLADKLGVSIYFLSLIEKAKLVPRPDIVDRLTDILGLSQEQRSILAAELDSAATTDEPPVYVFLCHAHEDKPNVRQLYNQLRGDDIEVWFDEEDLLPGQQWEYEIEQAIRAVDAVIVCASPRSVSKAGYVQREIRYALERALEQPEGAIFIIPVRIEACKLPKMISHLQYVDLFTPNGYSRLLRSLREGVRRRVLNAAPTA